MRKLTQLGTRPGHLLRAGTVVLGVRTQDEILNRVLTLEVIRAATRGGESIQVESGRGHLPGKSGWPVAQVAGELKMMDDVRCQPVERVHAADYPRAGARSAPEFMRRLS